MIKQQQLQKTQNKPLQANKRSKKRPDKHNINCAKKKHTMCNLAKQKKHVRTINIF